METTETATEKPQGFLIETCEHVEWALGKIAALEAEERLIAAQSQKALARLRSERESFTGRFLPQIEAWSREELARTKAKRKSIVFLHGTVQFTTAPARLVVENAEDALQTARLVCPEAVTEVPASEKLDKAKLIAYAKTKLESEGELLPGLALTEATERVALKFAEASETQEGAEE